MQTAQLVIVQTSPACLSYRLIVAGRVVFLTRAFSELEQSRQGARARCERWAARHGYTVVADAREAA